MILLSAELDTPLTRGLACAALSSGLRSMLLYDATPATLTSATALLAQMIEVVTEQQPAQPVTLSYTATEDDLWGSLSLSQADRGIVQRHGLLTGEPDNPVPRIVIIPNLTRLSLAAARACVMLTGAEVAHLERHGQRTTWVPDMYWIAGCASNDIGQVSSHLLDRFALRLNGPIEGVALNRRVQLHTWLQQQQPPGNEASPLPAPLVDRLHRAAQHFPEMTDAAFTRMLDYFDPTVTAVARREQALIRLAVALARLDAAPEVDASYVDTAAQLIGLVSSVRQTEDKDSSLSETQPSNAQSDQLPATPSDPGGIKKDESDATREQDSGQSSSKPVYASDNSELLEPLPMLHTSGTEPPYPEDTAPLEHELTPLRLPWRRTNMAATARGQIIGVERTTGLYDLALVRTLLEAAKFKNVRHKRRVEPTKQPGNALMISPTDLHRYRHAAVPEQVLVLLLDYTCLRGWDWWAVVKPHIQWAYSERASISIIQVGANSARNYLRAERVMARSVLNPRVDAALNVQPGAATPLAHGLDLALQTLRHVLQHGRAAAFMARLVVISDGRGNVPLAVSYAGTLTQPVGREGVDDALQIAHSIRRLKGIDTHMASPNRRLCADLPFALAEALGTVLITPQNTDVDQQLLSDMQDD